MRKAPNTSWRYSAHWSTTAIPIWPADDGSDSLNLEVSIFKSIEEDGEPILCAIEDEAELQAVYDLIMDSLYSEDAE